MKKRLHILVLLFLASVTTAVAAAQHKFTLVIDAGHGGNDAGAVGSISKEKDINLRTALAFGRYVENNCPDVKVIYTRKTDVFVTLHGRADIANKAKADLFISIHTNSLPKGHIARGFETYTLGMHRAGDNLDVAKRENSVILVEKDYKERYEGFDPNSSESYIIFEFMQDNNMARSVELAKLVQSNACATAGRPNKGVKQAGFLVLRETSMPSCLIELGFISTPDEEQFLNTEAGINNLAAGIFKAFVRYKQKYDTNINVPYKAEEIISNLPSVVPKDEPKVEPAKDVKEHERAQKEHAKEQRKESVKENNDTAKGHVDAENDKNDKKASDGKPVFKVQICAVDRVLKNNDARLKGHSEAEYYKENGMVKYTLGATSNYNEIVKIKQELNKDFPGAFIIAFKDGEKINVNEARKIK